MEYGYLLNLTGIKFEMAVVYLDNRLWGTYVELYLSIFPRFINSPWLPDCILKYNNKIGI